MLLLYCRRCCCGAAVVGCLCGVGVGVGVGLLFVVCCLLLIVVVGGGVWSVCLLVCL